MVRTPRGFRAALSKSKKALAKYETFPPSHKREVLDYILEAKKPETRARRIAKTVTWLAAGAP